MQVVILAGGYGTRISEETHTKPKPMIAIGSMPIIWHIMKIYSFWGFKDFVICLGYKGNHIKKFFYDYMLDNSDLLIDLDSNQHTFINSRSEPWKVLLVDTGLDSLTGKRLSHVLPYIKDDTFCMTYGDGLCDVNIVETIQYHQSHKSLCTLTAVQTPGRFGAFTLDNAESKITAFNEKSVEKGAWINGGFFIMDKKAIDYVGDLNLAWEAEPMKELAKNGKLNAFRHHGFWHCMDTLRDKVELNDIWKSGNAPWKIWKD
jgi:glucose-1-phosphate cytidylyltransferase